MKDDRVKGEKVKGGKVKGKRMKDEKMKAGRVKGRGVKCHGVKDGGEKGGRMKHVRISEELQILLLRHLHRNKMQKQIPPPPLPTYTPHKYASMPLSIIVPVQGSNPCSQAATLLAPVAGSNT